MSYCQFVANLSDDNIHVVYHNTQYGFPITNDDALFGRLILEINQAGLSWTTILQKQHSFYEAYDGFSIKRIANYQQADIDRLLNNPGIIRNKLKIQAVIYNAGVVLALQQQFGSWNDWLQTNKHLYKEQWIKLFKKHFKFTGGEIVGEFLMSIGMLPGAHEPNCPIYKQLKKVQ